MKGNEAKARVRVEPRVRLELEVEAAMMVHLPQSLYMVLEAHCVASVMPCTDLGEIIRDLPLEIEVGHQFSI